MEQKVIFFGVDGLMPQLVHKFSREGHLPHITQMLNQGSGSELLPFISAWGDLNWVSLITGQSPGSSWKGHGVPPKNDDNLLGLMDKQGKKCALVHFPDTVSTEGTGHISFAPFWGRGGAAPFEIASPTIYSTFLHKWPAKKRNEFLGWPPKEALAFHLKGNQRPVKRLDNGYSFAIELHDGTKLEVRIELIDTKTIRLIFPGNTTIDLALNDWSAWTPISCGNVKGTVRFKLLAYDPEKNELDLLQSQMNANEGFSNDPDVERFLIDRCGPFISKWTVKASPEELYYDTSFEEGEYQATWLAEAALRLLNEQNFHLFATVFRLVDETQHNCLGQYDTASPFYTAERALVYEETIRKSYQVLDRAIGKIIREKSDDTLLLLVSDHGNVPNAYLCDVNRRLEQCGLSKLDDDGKPVWDQTKAYLKADRGGLEIYVNLKGREEQGIVDPEQYEQVQTEIFKALTTWYHETPKGLQNVIGITLKKQDAAMIGYWGSEAGDVIFAYNQGFVWGTNHNRDVVAAVSSPGANHGPQIPSASTASSSNYGIALLYGPTTKNGYQRDRKKSGPYLMNDVGKTIAKAVGLQKSETLDGRYMDDLFVD